MDACNSRCENQSMRHHGISAPAAMLADPTRAAIVLALMDGRSHPAKKLALDAGVTPQTASVHLKKLVAASILDWEGRGRCKYFRIAGPDVAHAVEALSQIGALADRQLPAAARELRFARCCYDHLAGQLGVAITERLPLLREGLLGELGVDLGALEKLRRPLSRCCIDWTEQRPHVAGSLGAALLRVYKDKRWLLPLKESRKLLVTARGRTMFMELFGLDAAFFNRES
jgi:DNA-binding transcriptional ArsR family regulator